MDSARRLGYFWPTTCGGIAECGSCRCQISKGIENVDPPTAAERLIFRILPQADDQPLKTRLACQMTVTGPVTVIKRGVKAR